jgi:hypothetical protein
MRNESRDEEEGALGGPVQLMQAQRMRKVEGRRRKRRRRLRRRWAGRKVSVENGELVRRPRQAGGGRRRRTRKLRSSGPGVVHALVWWWVLMSVSVTAVEMDCGDVQEDNVGDLVMVVAVAVMGVVVVVVVGGLSKRSSCGRGAWGVLCKRRRADPGVHSGRLDGG